MLKTLDLWGQRGWYGQEVAGESYHSEALQRVLGSVGEQGRELICVAELVPEPTNPHDKNAVQVQIDGRLVGHLPRADAVRYQPVLMTLTNEGWLPQVRARVWGRLANIYDYDNRGRLVERPDFMGSVRLDLAEPHLLIPANAAPVTPHVMLPLGSAIQVTDEESHMADLVPLLSAEGECWVHATLHEIVETTPRTSKALIEVRIDGAAAGKLTPKMSGELMPVVRYLNESDIVSVCRAMLKGNRLKADVTLYVARAGEVPAEWLDNPPITATARRSSDADLVESSSDNTDATWRFNPPPGWPPPPPGWTPAQGWVPPAHLPAAPPEWQWWLPV